MKLTGRHLFAALVVLILALAGYLRVEAARSTVIDGPLRADAGEYFLYAFNLDHFGVYSKSEAGLRHRGMPRPDATRPPGYPLFLAPLVDHADVRTALARIVAVQVLVSFATVLVYLFLYRSFLPPPLALAATLLTAISPHLVNTGVYVLTECLFTLLLGLAVLATRAAACTGTRAAALLAGGAIAASSLVRPTTLLMPLFVIPVLQHARGCACRRTLALLVLLPVVVGWSAWSLRNLAATGSATDGTLLANFLRDGSYIGMMYKGRSYTYGYPYRFDPDTPRLAGRPLAELRHIARRFLARPWPYLRWYLIGKPAEFFAWNLTESVGDAFVYRPLRSPYFDDPVFRLTHALARGVHYPATLLALLAMVTLLARWRGARAGADPAPRVLALVLLYFVLVHMAGAPFPRYSIPTRPLVYGLAMLPLSWLWDRRRMRPVQRGAGNA